MKYIYLALFFLVAITSIGFSKCYTIHLKDGTKIEGVEVKKEELFGNKYLVYNFKGSTSISRIEYNVVSKIVYADCATAPTPIIKQFRSTSPDTRTPQTAPEGQARKQMLENMKTPEFSSLGIMRHNLIQPSFVEIQIDELAWSRLPYDDKISLLNILDSGWKNACQKDGVGHGSVLFKGYRSGKTLATRAWHGDWRINS
jgi:hypothetical protein